MELIGLISIIALASTGAYHLGRQAKIDAAHERYETVIKIMNTLAVVAGGYARQVKRGLDWGVFGQKNVCKLIVEKLETGGISVEVKTHRGVTLYVEEVEALRDRPWSLPLESSYLSSLAYEVARVVEELLQPEGKKGPVKCGGIWVYPEGGEALEEAPPPPKPRPTKH